MKEAKVRLRKGEFGWYWLNKECPVCGKKHTYGAGSLKGKPVQGDRMSKCIGDILAERVALVPVNQMLTEILDSD